MANLKRTVLGIEIGTYEVRMVEMRGGGNLPQIVKAGSVRLPEGAMDGTRVVQVDAIADILKGLYARLGCHARAAIVGMGVQSVVTRILAIPRVPDSELRSVLEGELAHYQILRAGTGAFDYFRLESPNPTSDSLPSVLLMAVEDRIAQGYRLVIEKAGLQMLALEPITLALFRAAYPMLEAEPAALCLAITPQRSELSILDHGQIRLYRRLEMGSDDFIRGRKDLSSAVRGPVNLTGDPAPMADSPVDFSTGTLLNTEPVGTAEIDTADLDTADLEGAETSRGGTGPLSFESVASAAVIPQAAAAFSNEVQRSLDYYRREYPNATAIGRIILTTSDPDASAVSEWLSQSLRMDIRITEPSTDPGLPRQVAQQLEAPQGLRFLGATGLALHPLTPDWRQVPRFNLLTGGPTVVAPMERDRLTLVMICAVGILAAGFITGGLFYRNAETESGYVTQKQRELGLRQQEALELLQQIKDEDTLEGIVKSDHMPVPAILDLLTQPLPPGVRLGNIDIQPNGHIVVEGNAREMAYFTLYYSSLLQCPHFIAPRWQYITDDPSTRTVRFRVETSLKGTQDGFMNQPTVSR